MYYIFLCLASCTLVQTERITHIGAVGITYYESIEGVTLAQHTVHVRSASNFVILTIISIGIRCAH